MYQKTIENVIYLSHHMPIQFYYPREISCAKDLIILQKLKFTRAQGTGIQFCHSRKMYDIELCAQRLMPWLHVK